MATETTLAPMTLNAGVVVHIEGIPTQLQSDTVVLTHPANEALIRTLQSDRAGQASSGAVTPKPL